jgi:hypothetical protein
VESNVFVDTKSVDQYDPATDTWTPMADVPAAISSHAAAEANGKIHAVGGSAHF